jgi:hypothetical protein
VGRDAVSARFYCVADDRYFLGVVGLVNSLRLVGHTEPIHLLDCGLSISQRALLEPHAELADAPDDAPPWLLKIVLPLSRPAPVAVLLDADMVVTRGLQELIERAAEGRVVAFRNPVDRFHPEWGELLDLGPTRRRPYMSSAAIALGGELGREVLALMADRQDRVDFERTHWRRAEEGYPFTYADQDVFNAILATSAEAASIVELDQRLAPTPPFDGLRLVDERSLRCSYDDGVEPYLVHHHTIKPWLEPTHHGIYSRLLRRLLIGDGLAISLPRSEIPLRLRTGLRALAERKRINARERFRWHVREPISHRIASRRR